MNIHLTVSFIQANISQRPLASHICVILPAAQDNVSHLTVIFSAVNMIRRSADHNPAVGRNRLYFVVLACKCQELARNQRLEYMTVQFCSDIVLLAFFIFRNVICILKSAGKFRRLCLVFNSIILFRFRPDAVSQQHFFEVNSEIDFVDAAVLFYQLFKCINGRLKAYAADHQRVRDFFFAHLFSRHTHKQLQDCISLCSCIIRDNCRHSLRISNKRPRVLKHIIAQEIILADHIDKALLFCSCRKETDHFKQVLELILHNKERILRHSEIPEIRIHLKCLVEAFLADRQIRVAADLFIVLAGDPFHICYREFFSADPLRIRDLIFHGHRIDFGSDSQIS